MPLPRFAIIGRPNVGKSSLLNMLAGRKASIVDPTPGVTRDRVSVVVELDSPDGSGAPRRIELVDTGGFGVYTAEGKRYDEVGADLASLTPDIERQIQAAVQTADLVLFVIDAQVGVTAEDRHIAKLLRERGMGRPGRGGSAGAGKAGEAGEGEGAEPARLPPVLVLANKTDGPKWEPYALDAAELGFGEAQPVGAKNNYMRRALIDRLWEEAGARAPARPEAQEAMHADMLLAIVGKRNAGKSSLVNALAGEDRVIVSEIAGTTRDAVDVRLELDGRSLVVIDTAGLRKRKSVQDRVEWFAMDRTASAVQRADVVLFLVDATEPVSQVDEQVGKLVADAFKPAIVVVNKWDLAEGRPGPTGKPVTTQDYETYLRQSLRGLWYAPISFISAKERVNLRPTVLLAFEMFEQASQRVGTGRLNRLVREILERRGPSSKLGTFAKVYYVAQVAVRPPTIVLVVNKPELFTPNYKRYLLNRFREELPFKEVPIRLLVRARKRGEKLPAAEQEPPPSLVLWPEELAEGGHARGGPARRGAAGAGGLGAGIAGEIDDLPGGASGPEAHEHEDEVDGDEGDGGLIGLDGDDGEADLDDLPDDADAYFKDE